MWGETKLPKMVRSCSLAPQLLGLALRFVNNVYVRAESAGSTAHGHHKALTWSQTPYSRPVRASPRKPWLLRHMGYTGAASWLCYMRLCHGCVTAQFSSVTQSCLTLCDPMNRSTPGLPAHYQLPELAQTHVDQVMPSSHLILCRPLLLLPPIPPASESFPMNQLFS